MTRRRLSWPAALLALSIALAWASPLLGRAPLPSKLTDQEFWELTERVSEPNGDFQSDNFLSNERGYQVVIPDLVQTAKPGRVYLGVGPEQNFPYIVALKPAMAIIFDVRRGNLHEQLLYKALFEMSADRADFLSRLFSRKRPDGLTASSSVTALMDRVRQGRRRARSCTRRISRRSATGSRRSTASRSTRTTLPGIDYVYRTAFFAGGPQLSYNMAGRGARGTFGGRGNQATYADIQALDDGRGRESGISRDGRELARDEGSRDAQSARARRRRLRRNESDPRSRRVPEGTRRRRLGVLSLERRAVL